ncbi:nucleotidyltransferase [Cellulosilyticum ruminicola]|uniref:nucleotidyltransferase n=1 Tax=Cellulosilyticum ruminicola TaxID=425254 RepID=UPI0006D29FAC|nr:nucleotidyltransferase [Cellulosilyticum ruminicola]
MHIAGIVAEYNPFHNGHAYQIQTLKKEKHIDFVIAVMSGHFSQRGLPTIADKFTRTKMALDSGIDIVIELPTPFATSSAERFSEAAISLLHQTGIVDTLCFGSECGNLEALDLVATTLINPPPVFSTKLKAYLRSGLSFPRAREQALIDTLEVDSASIGLYSPIINNPNNILGIEYIKALHKYNSNIKPFTITRIHAGYHDLHITGSITSATAIRHLALKKDFDTIKTCMPPTSFNYLNETLNHIPSYEKLYTFLNYKLIMSNKEDLYALWDIPKELIHSILNHFPYCDTLEKLIDMVSSKTYTRATVQRSLLRILLHITKEDISTLESLAWTPYIRILGCKRSALSLLGKLSKKATCPVITNVGKSYVSLNKAQKCLMDYELKATALYHSLSCSGQNYKQDFTQSFIKL